jgi:uncharacterized protein YecT (DUF1311 family)
MNMRYLSAIIVVVLLPPISPHRGAEQTDKINSGCESATTTAEMRACENTRYEKADRDLNAVYKQLMSQLDENRQDKLRTAQRAWLQFREANADFAASLAEGGTLAPLLKISAIVEMTEARTSELKKDLDQ